MCWGGEEEKGKRSLGGEVGSAVIVVMGTGGGDSLLGPGMNLQHRGGREEKTRTT